MISCAVTDIGRSRADNQDYVYASDRPVGRLGNLYMVADGMGGHRGGGYASRYTVERMTELLASMKQPGEVRSFHDAIRLVNRELHEKADSCEDLYGMGTTLVAATVSGGILYVANIGDSRLYRIGEFCRQITRDHSWVEEMVAQGKLERDSELFRSRKNIITRAIGVGDQVTADFFEVELNAGDRILLCSDGLSNMLPDEEIYRIVYNAGSCREAAESLVAAANEAGGKDNISAVVAEAEIEEVQEC